MKISKIKIQNYKSIDKLEEVSFVDRRISCLIGKNGSGKSNLLHAIKALKDNSFLMDEFRYEKANKDEEIRISAVIELEEIDAILLKSSNLSLNDLKSFRVNVVKKKSEDPIRSFNAENYNKDFDKLINLNLKKIASFIKNKTRLLEEKNSTTEPSSPNEVETVEPALNTEESSVEKTEIENEKLLQKMVDLHNQIFSDNPLRDQKILLEYLNLLIESKTYILNDENFLVDFETLINDTKNIISFNIESFIQNTLWDKLSINLLDLNNYPVESIAKKSELKDASHHPFLYDLLSLSEKTINLFSLEKADEQNTERDASGNISKALAKVWKQHKVNLQVVSQNSNLFYSFETPQKRTRGLDDLSEGEKWFLRFYTKLAIANKIKNQIIWLFDEPGQSLHATSQLDLKSFFEITSENSQIIYTSHQPMMIQWQRLERILVADNDSELGTTITSRFWTDEELVSPLKEALGLFIGEQIFTGLQHIVVEGVSDYIHLQGWSLYFQKTRTGKIWSGESSMYNRTLIPAGSRDCIPLYLLFLSKKTKGKISTIAIPDSKSDAESVKTKISNFGLDPVNKRVKSISGLVGDANLKGIEDVYDPSQFLKYVKEFYAQKYSQVKIDDKFLTPTTDDIKDGIVKYIDQQLNKSNPNYYTDDNRKLTLDKPGIAFFIYDLLTRNTKIFSKETEAKFAKIFKSLNTFFNK